MTQAAEPTDKTRPTTAIVIRATGSTRALAVEKLRAAVLSALAQLQVPLVLTAALDAHHYLSRLSSAGRVLVIGDSPSVLAELRQEVPATLDVTFCLLVAPTTLARWGELSSDWAKGISATAGARMVYLTDSPLARSVVESHLRDVRADVRVLTPLSSDTVPEESPAGWTFERASRTNPTLNEVAFSGVGWDFSPHVPSPTERPQDAGPADRADANAAVLSQLVSAPTLAGGPLRVSILGHKLSFIDELARDLAHESGSLVELDEWKHLSAPSDLPRANRLVAQADVVIGEWARPNNVWIQAHAARHTRLIVRAHRYEVTTDFPRAIDMARFHAGVVIVPWVGRSLVQQFCWPAEKLVYIPNYVNSAHFRRPKLAGSEFTLGIVGITPDLKRLDLALDLLRALRQSDARYTLRVRGQLPTEHIHWGKNPLIAEQWGSVLTRLRIDPLLRNSVFFDEPGRDMAAWFEGIGVILSTSDLEGSHVALAEGMASGALPVVRAWPGVRTLWPSEAIFEQMDAAVNWILQSQDAEWRAATIERFTSHPSLDQRRVLAAWWDLVNGHLDRAQAAFGPIDWHADLYEPVDLAGA